MKKGKSIKELSVKTGKSLNTIYKHVAASGLKADKKGNYDEEQVLDYLKKRQELDANNKTRPGSVREAQQVIKLQLMKHELDIAQGKTMPMDDVYRKFSECGSMIKSRILAVPNMVATICEGKTAVEISAILFKELHRALEDLSK